jgi:DNA helicase-2/ATP-dependent DNA helicase PcrA
MTFVPSAEQAAILAAPLGPMRINAGAGTGKTTTLTKRIVGLVHGGMNPSRILGLTFTNKAAAELADRVTEELAADTARSDVEVHTYHGFGYQILSEFGPFVGVERDVKLITPTFSRQLLLDAVGDAESYQYLNIGQRERVIDATLRLASDLGDNLSSADQLLAQSGNDVEMERREMAEVINRFHAEKLRLGVIDFADLVRLAHQIATRHPHLARRIRSRYDVVFLDEYQDTNAGQRLLLQALFGEGFPVIAVGDPDQTIYEWRGATPSNFNRFDEHFPTTSGAKSPTRHLTLNRRSGQAILDIANRVRAKAGTRHREPLAAAPGTDVGLVTASWYRTSWQEATSVADRLRDAYQSGTEWRDMAVLLRTNAAITVIRQALAEADIPAEVASDGGLLDVPEVVELHAWLRLLNDPTDNVAFARIAMGSSHQLNRSQMQPIKRFSDTRPDLDEGFIELLDHLEAIDGLSNRAVSVFTVVRSHYGKLLQAAQSMDLAELVRRILDVNDLWKEIEAMPGVASLSARLNVYRFLDLAEAWSPLEGRPSLKAFLDYLSLLRMQTTDEVGTARVSQESAVMLLTVHRAKGLEWDVVCLPGLTKGRFPSGVRDFEDPFAKAWVLPFDQRIDRLDLPPLSASMDQKERHDLLRERHFNQEWRLAYVAITRARTHLHASGAAWIGTNVPLKKPTEPSEFLDAIAESADTSHWEVDPGDRPATLHPTDPYTAAPDPVFADGWAQGLQDALASPAFTSDLATQLDLKPSYDQAVKEFEDMLFSLPTAPAKAPEPTERATSVTGMVTAARCPQQFKWSEIDRLPRRPSNAARRGVEVHRKIELHNMGQVPLDDFSSMEYDVPTDVPAKTSGQVTGAYETYLGSRFAESRPLFTETAFSFRVGSTTLRGRVDAIYAKADGWEIVDFKSGRPSSDPSLVTQLEAYAVAAASGALGPVPSKMWVTFAYLGDGLTEVTQEVTAEWLLSAQRHLEVVSVTVQEGPFEPSPSDSCTRCDFLKFCPAGQKRAGKRP